MKKTKKCSDSRVIKTELVLPNDTNGLNNLMGGRLMHWMDIASAISAQRHSNRIVVTAFVDNISFSKPIKKGNTVTVEAFVTRAFNSSMEVYVNVLSEDIPSGECIQSNEAFFTFVAVDQSGRTIDMPEVVPETPFEKKLFDGALKRREIRLLQIQKNKAK